MKNIIRLNLILLLLGIISSACTRNYAGPSVTGSEQIETQIPDATPTPTVTPQPTPTFTPLPSTRIENAEYSLFIGNYQAAQEEFLLASQSTSDINLQASAEIGMAVTLIEQNNCPRALEYLNKWTSSNDIENLIKAKSQYYSGYCYEQQNNYDDAVNAFLGYIEANPGIMDTRLYEKIGDIFLSSNDQENAISYYEKAISSNSDGDNSALKIKDWSNLR